MQLALCEPRGGFLGRPAFWTVILGDLAVFTTFFMIFAWYRGQDMELFAQSQALMSRTLGLLNTLLLLTSSLFVAIGVHRTRDTREPAQNFFLAAIICGVGFVVVKIIEFGMKISQGVGLTENRYFTLYFIFASVHLFHVLIGLSVLLFIWSSARRPEGASQILLMECGATFWHLVDLLWIVLFALFYVLR